MKIIYLKYGELTLKGKNKKVFINQLFQNIKIALKIFDLKIVKQYDSSLVKEIKEEDFDGVVSVLKIFQVFLK